MNQFFVLFLGVFLSLWGLALASDCVACCPCLGCASERGVRNGFGLKGGGNKSYGKRKERREKGRKATYECGERVS